MSLRRRPPSVIMPLLGICALAQFTLASCSLNHQQGAKATSPASITTTPPPASSTTTATTTTIPLVTWSGPVEHLFFHTLVINPGLAFHDPKEGQGFRNYFVTVREFRAILDQLYANGWTLVDIRRAIAGDVRVPVGRKPFVLSEDDVNYYKYENGLGLGSRLVLQDGHVKVEEPDGHGGVTISGNDIVPILEEFITRHPDFSADGARGVLALTGYEGLFGERVNEETAPDLGQRQERVKQVADALKAEGWVLASHSYGHIDFTKESLNVDRRDIERWKAKAEPLLGKTDAFIYPFGAAPPVTSPIVSMLRDEGFTILCDIDAVPRITRANGVSVMARRHIDGLALDEQHANLAPLFDTGAVEDTAARKR